MNIINVKIDFTNGINKLTGINLITGDYASTKMVFNFDRKDGTKLLEMKNPSGEVVFYDEIINNEVILCSVENGLNYSIFNEEGRYIYEVSLYNGDSKLTSVKGELPVQKEQVIIDGEIVEPYLPYFDRLMQEISTAITETNNLNVTASKVDTTTTITITRKNGTSYEVEVLDGLKGDKGDKGDAGAVKAIPVQTLPTEDIDDSAIYLVPMPKIEVETLPETGTPNTIYIVTSTQKRYIYSSNQWIEITQDNNYLEYMYINNKWELLGALSMQIDLTNYVKFTDIATTTSNGVIRASDSYQTSVDSGGSFRTRTIAYNTYQSMSNNAFIGKGTLENVITGKGLVSNTDYATTSVGGVFKIDAGFGTSMSNTGFLRAGEKTYEQYQSSGANMFISKGTLENVIDGKGLTTKSYVDGLVGNIGTILDSINNEVL